MAKTLFIKEDVFKSICKKNGYKDVDTIYGDLSRLVVAFLKNTDPKVLKKTYELEYEPEANINAIKKILSEWDKQ